MKDNRLTFDTANGPSTAFVALPANGASKHCIIVIHEWWGLNDHIKDICMRYAAEGFTVIAPDLYRGRVLTDPNEASEAMHSLKIEDGLEIIGTAMAVARSVFGINHFGITGYCMGGTFALRAACDLEGISAAVPFYGDIPDEGILSTLRTPTVFISGTQDSWITPEKVQQMEAVADSYELPLTSVKYDAPHAFFNDTRKDVFDEVSARDAWSVAVGFFRDKL